jgi:hypothetical protein
MFHSQKLRPLALTLILKAITLKPNTGLEFCLRGWS